MYGEWLRIPNFQACLFLGVVKASRPESRDFQQTGEIG